MYLQQIATNFSRENYLHTEQGNCQREEQSICCGQGYNYLAHPNTVGHKSFTLSLARCSAQTFNKTLLANNNQFGSPVNNNSTSSGPFPEKWKTGSDLIEWWTIYMPKWSKVSVSSCCKPLTYLHTLFASDLRIFQKKKFSFLLVLENNLLYIPMNYFLTLSVFFLCMLR